MPITVRFSGVEKTIELGAHHHDITLADLVESVLGRKVHGRIWIDAQEVDADATLDEVNLIQGSVVSDERKDVVKDTAAWTVRVVAGEYAGLPIDIPEGRAFTVGRSPQADLTLTSPLTSWAHAALSIVSGDLVVKDLGSSNGTMIGTETVSSEGRVIGGDDPVTIVFGGAAVVVQRGLPESAVRSAGRVTPVGTVPFNRPPRSGLMAGPDEITVPAKTPPSEAPRFGWTMVVAPIIFAVVMIVLMNNLRFALFALLSPVMAVATFFEQKRKSKQANLESDQNYLKDLNAFEADVAHAGEEERRRLNELAPDVGVALMRASLPATSMWQRRFGAADYLKLNVGIGHRPWDPPIDSASERSMGAEPKQILENATISYAPIDIDLGNAGVVGIYGDRKCALALARSLIVQMTSAIGPADLALGVFADSGVAEDWDWAGWLPHSSINVGGRSQDWLGFSRSTSDRLLSGLRENVDGLPAHSMVLVIDSIDLLEGRDSPARDLLGHGRFYHGAQRSNQREVLVSGIVIAENAEKLPASCTTTIEVQPGFEGTVTIPAERLSLHEVILTALDRETAANAAQDLAHYEDPEVKIPGAALPGRIDMLPLLDLRAPTAEDIVQRWSERRGFRTPVGVSEEGTYSLDLVRDGPHGLVGGTTGSGKSEFLRTLVAGLAASVDPEHLSFILIDFKGGAAFAACNDLPHTIGTISNLDAQLADRAIRALEAEMTYRQEMFARAGEGVDNIDAYLATNPVEPMPRILLVIDEFAQMAKEMPDALASLVSVAAVGRTLGVHMILATQRPAGVVNDDILANTNMRVALRVQGREDSTNVIGVPDAASISREQRGRAYVKLGQDDISPIQTALVTGYSEVEEAQTSEFSEITFGQPAPPPAQQSIPAGTENDLDMLIGAIKKAHAAQGYADPRKVWPEALGDRVDLLLTDDEERAGLAHVASVAGPKVVIGLADDPDHQRQIPAYWDLTDGNLVLLGIPGSGTTTTLKTIALSMADHLSPDKLDLYIFDLGARELADLEALPHVVGYAGTGVGGAELQTRMIKFLNRELKRRQGAVGEDHPKILVLFDGFAGFRDDNQDTEGFELLDQFYRVYSDGPDVGIHMAVTASRVKSIPGQIEDVTTQKWLFRLTDVYDYVARGIAREQVPPPVPGRAVPVNTKLHTHVATPRESVEASVAALRKRYSHFPAKGSKIRLLPDRVWVDDARQVGRWAGEPICVPVGISESDLNPMSIDLYQGEHFFIAGPARSGKSSVLLGIGQALQRQATENGKNLALYGVGGRRSPLRDAGLTDFATGEDAIEIFVNVLAATDPTILLIDDAEQIEDSQSMLPTLLTTPRPDLLIIAAGRADDIRANYGHWSKTMRRSRAGILLNPNIDFDGDLLGVRLPRRSPVHMGAGRGYACSGGTATLVQAITADIGR